MKPMRTADILTAQATTEPLSVEDALFHARIDSAEEGAYVASLISQARSMIEMQTGRAMSDESRALLADCWADSLDLQRSPATVTAITYFPADGGAAVTVSASDYVLSETEPACVVFKESFSYPALALRPDAVRVSYKGTPATLPPALLAALKILVADMYEQRVETITGTIVAQQKRLQDIITSHRIGGFVA